VTNFRELAGSALRRRRQAQARTLREVADAAGVSLAYLSEVERGRKEPSSEVLEAVCAALGVLLSDVLFEVAHTLVRLEAEAAPAAVPVGFAATPGQPAPAEPVGAEVPVAVAAEPVPAGVLDLQAFAARRSA
jgi:transcriptional regulator with XRE-family HTH domain